MTRTLFWSATGAFWLALAAFWLGSLSQPATEPNPASAAERRIASSEIARHASADDCWMAIRGGVYDVSAYIPEHPTRPDIVTAWCGKDATEAYDTKNRGRPHSPYADERLAKHRIGTLDAMAK